MRRRLVFLGALSIPSAAAVLFAAALMMSTQTYIAVPDVGSEVALSGLAYKAPQFVAKLTALRFESQAPDADPFEADWIFLGSNSDGQLHRFEIQLRLLDENGSQLAMPSRYFAMNGGAHDAVFKFETKLKAEVWKATRRVRIVVNWVN